MEIFIKFEQKYKLQNLWHCTSKKYLFDTAVISSQTHLSVQLPPYVLCCLNAFYKEQVRSASCCKHHRRSFRLHCLLLCCFHMLLKRKHKSNHFLKHRSLAEKTRKCHNRVSILISRFMENVNKQQRNFISLSELGHGPLEFNFRRVCLHLTK